MNEGRTVFDQLMDQLPKYELDKCIVPYGGNRRMRSFSTYEQFLTMAFSQLTYRDATSPLAFMLSTPNSTTAVCAIRSLATPWPTSTKNATGASSPTLLRC
ncbi:DUF4372 domain-containing protein [bacterium]|nr:DUF4372 domain-containing protein [bacterium]